MVGVPNVRLPSRLHVGSDDLVAAVIRAYGCVQSRAQDEKRMSDPKANIRVHRGTLCRPHAWLVPGTAVGQ
jgi:hypothetical protein